MPHPPQNDRRAVRARARTLARSVLVSAGLAALTTTCDASRALSPGELRDVVMTWQGDTLLVSGSTQVATVAVTLDGKPDPQPRLRLTSSNPSIVSVSADGRTLEALRIGKVTVTAQLVDAMLPSPAPTLVTNLVVSPGALRLGALPDTIRSIGDTVRLTATAVDADGEPIAGVPVTWRSTDTTVATIDAAGLVTSRSNGRVGIHAEVGAATADATIEVRQRAASVRLTPAVLRLDALGADSIIAAQVVDARGVPLGALAPAVSWTSTVPGVATVTAGKVTALTNGSAWVQVAAGSVRDSVAVTVAQVAVRVVVETPSPVSLRSIGETAIMRARAYDRRENEVQLGVPSWRSLNPLVVHVEPQTGVATGLAEGSAMLQAELDGVSAPAVVEVANVPARVLLDPEVATITSVGDTLQLSWSVRNARGAGISGVTVAFASSDSSIVRTTAAGRAIAAATGTARVIATATGGIADTSLITVINAVAHVDVATDVITLASVADTSIPAVSLRNARGAELPRTAAVWSSDDAGVARVTAAGLIIATGAGETFVRATSPHYADRRDSVALIVTNAPASVLIGQDTDAMGAVGASRAYAAEVRNARNALVAATPEWRTLDAAVAKVSATGLVTALGVGTARIVASAGAAADTLVLTVRNDVVSLDLSPATATLTSVGDVIYPTVTGRNALGEAAAPGTLTWVSTDTTVLRIADAGGVLGAATGTARVIVTSGAVADTMTITVINAVAQVAIAPDAIAMASVGDTVVPAASIRNARGAELPRGSASWSSDNAGVARVTSTGAVIAAGEGETFVRVASPQYPERRDSVAVTVTNAPASVTIERDTDLMTAVGTTRAYTVEVRNARNALLSVIPEWRTLDGAVAKVNASGVVSAVGAGTARIVGAAGTVADTLVVTVRDDIVTIEVTPASATLTSLGDELHPVATARNALGGLVSGAALTWTITDTTVARLTTGQGVLAAGVGSTRLIVADGSVADTVALTVTNLPALIDIAGTADTIPAIGDSVVLSTTVRNARGDLLTGAALAWSVDDPVVARVGTTGTVTARGAGETWVRAAGGTARDSIWILVTNEPASIAISLASSRAPAMLDTMTATGQSLVYAASVANSAGIAIADAVVSWRSTDAAVVQVSPSGQATAVGLGAALVVAKAGAVEDTVQLIVIDPRRLYVDNAVVTPERFGTLARPYATIQDAIDAAGVDDTVIVRRGRNYSEAVNLGRRVTLLGDSTDFVVGGRDPLLLPLLRHDLGAAGISAATPGASYTIRYLGIQHSVDGEAIAARDADNLVMSEIYVNPVPSFRTGRGILVERASGSVNVTRSRVDSVYAFGIRVREAPDLRLEAVTVRSVAARSGFVGAGIEVIASGGVVTGAQVRRTAGPQVRFSRTTGISLLASTLTGEQQLVQVDSASSSTTVSGNTLDLRLQAGEASPARGGGLTDPSGIEVRSSAGVLIENNTFTDIGGQASLMDGIRLTDVRVGTTGAAFGARLTGNRFGGGRSAVRSSRSNWQMTNSRVDSASVAVLLSDADTVSLARDTISASRTSAVQSAALGASVSISESAITGSQRAVLVSNAASVSLRSSTIAGTPFTGVAQPTEGGVDISATAAQVVGNTIIRVHGFAGLMLRGGTVRADSNVITRNLIGVRLAAGVVPALADNAIFDNDSMPAASPRIPRGLVNDGSALALGSNWWGAPEGAQSDLPLSPAARGDSVIGSVTVGTLVAPVVSHRGTVTPPTHRKFAGDGQAGVIGAPLAQPLAVRAVDANGKALAGVVVTFRVTRTSGDFPGSVRVGNDNAVDVLTDNNGLASVQYTPLASGVATISSVVDRTTIPFTVTVP